jgi:hypothetical protein
MRGGTRDALRNAILRQLSTVWRETITDELRNVGAQGSGVGPNGRDRRYLARIARRDARSVVDTYNRELRNQVRNLISEGYDKQGIEDKVRAWQVQRRDFKSEQIANMNRANARSYAQQRFDDENDIASGGFIFDGPAPRESVCAGHFAAGVVDREYVRNNPTPIHINCPHWWRRTGGVIIGEVWRG